MSVYFVLIKSLEILFCADAAFSIM